MVAEKDDTEHEAGRVPKVWGVPFPLWPEDSPPDNVFERGRRRIYRIFDVPVTWFKETVIEPLRGPKQVYYHRKFPRVPTIDECHEGDYLCYYEANEQYKRDRSVDDKIMDILRRRKENCMLYEADEWAKNCRKVSEDFEEALTNFFLRYGEVGSMASVVDPYMRQKHRMIWERRNPDKVDFMYARNQKDYNVPIERGFADSPQLPDNSRARFLKGVELYYPQSPSKEPPRM